MLLFRGRSSAHPGLAEDKMEPRHPTVQDLEEVNNEQPDGAQGAGTMLVALAGSNPTIAKFGDAFEGAFVFGKQGSLKVDAKHKDLMMKFVNDPMFRFVIALIGAPDMPDLTFEDQGYADVVTMMRNKVKAARYYGVCYSAYLKFCQVAHRHIAAGLLPPQQAQAIAEAIGAASSTQHDDDDDSELF